MSEVENAAGTTRGERKERTRQALLDAALALSEQHTFATVSLRQVTREVGIVPTAFYRHFASLDDLGLELVTESFASLRAMLRDVRRGDPSLRAVIDRSVAVLVEHVHARRAHFGFIARERVAGPAAVRDAVRRQIDLVERELATDVAAIVGTERWSERDTRVLANLIVTAMVAIVEAILGADGDPEAELVIADDARTQLRMLLVGAINWQTRADHAHQL
ncbi:TetR family transcriptional regulator [Nocardioides pacificus]